VGFQTAGGKGATESSPLWHLIFAPAVKEWERIKKSPAFHEQMIAEKRQNTKSAIRRSNYPFRKTETGP
jgi:hypothetical protein